MQDGPSNHDVAIPTPVFLTTASGRLDADTVLGSQDIGSIEMNAYRPSNASSGRIVPSSLPNPAIRPRDSSSSLGSNDFIQERGPPGIRNQEAETREFRHLYIYRCMQKVTVAGPTQPRGYPSLANFLNSHESFMIYRRFGFLQARLLLEKQGELCDLERMLNRVDQIEVRENMRQPTTRNLSNQSLPRRQDLLTLIEQKFCSYGECAIPP